MMHHSYQYKVLDNLKELAGKNILEALYAGSDRIFITDHTLLIYDLDERMAIPYRQAIREIRTLLESRGIVADQIIDLEQ